MVLRYKWHFKIAHAKASAGYDNAHDFMEKEVFDVFVTLSFIKPTLMTGICLQITQ